MKKNGGGEKEGKEREKIEREEGEEEEQKVAIPIFLMYSQC